jgi:hypothetical protein
MGRAALKVNIGERRIMPRFSISRMIFKDSESSFQIINISYEGMKLGGPGKIIYRKGQNIEGILSWFSSKCEVIGMIKWVKSDSLGVTFSEKCRDQVRKLLSLENVIRGMLPLHEINKSLPANLKYWLRSDGPYELLVWGSGRQLQSFQLILLDDFVEWINGIGIRTGKIIDRKSIDTPLFDQVEYTFNHDQSINLNTLRLGKLLLSKITHLSCADQKAYLSKFNA